jgi:hypothetical protein
MSYYVLHFLYNEEVGDNMKRKTILKESGVLLIVALMIFSAMAVTANTTDKRVVKENNSTGYRSSNKMAFSGIGDNLHNFAQTSMINLSNAIDYDLTLWTVYNITYPDTAWVQISTDNVTWTKITPIGGDPTGSQLEGKALICDIAAYEGLNVWFGFLYQTGSNSKSEGWYVDSIMVCSESNGTFVEDFEEYNVSDHWGDWIIVEKAMPVYVPGEAVITFYGPLPFFYQDIVNKTALKYNITLKHSNNVACTATYTNVNANTFNMLLNDEAVKHVDRNYYVKAFAFPNDPGWPNQWGPKRIGAIDAWHLIHDATVTVAVIDTGIDYTHPDLNFNYLAGGFNWVKNNNDPKDDNGHGTHCAGIIGAVGNNSAGITGMAWKIQIIAEKVLNWEGKGNSDDVAYAIYHAVNQGAKIISLSLGGDAGSQFLKDAVQFAYDNGCLVVAASGNDNKNSLSFPAAYSDQVISVGAINQADERCDPGDWGYDPDTGLPYGSNYGEGLELMAPGNNILSTFPSNQYAYGSGTSMACPHVAGVAALVWSINPVLTRDQVRCILRGTADDLGPTGYDQEYGYGCVMANLSVLEANSMFNITVSPDYQQISAGGPPVIFNYNVPKSQGPGTLVSLELDQTWYKLNSHLSAPIYPLAGTPTFSGTVTVTADPSAKFIKNVLRLKATYTMGGCVFARYSNFFTVANSVNPVDDVWIKSSDLDTGATNPRLGWLWTSPWISSIPEPPLLGKTNQLKITVGNLNTQNPIGPVYVQAYYNNYPSFIPVVSFPTLGPQTIPSIAAKDTEEVIFSWPLPYSFSHHVCMWAQAWTDQESFDPNMDQCIGYNNNVASHNFGPAYENSPYTTTFTVTNPTESTYLVTYYMKPPNTDWTIDLCNPSIYANDTVQTRIMIPPGGQRNLTLTVIMPPDEDSGFVDITHSIEGYEGLYSNVYTFEVIRDTEPPILEITNPLKGIYLMDMKIIPFPWTIVVGTQTITVNASDTQIGMDKVEFYVDTILVATVYQEPYQWVWSNSTGLFGRHTIMAIAYDHGGNSDMSANVIVWRFF